MRKSGGRPAGRRRKGEGIEGMRTEAMETNWVKRGARAAAALLAMVLLCIGVNVFAPAAGVSALAAERAGGGGNALY